MSITEFDSGDFESRMVRQMIEKVAALHDVECLGDPCFRCNRVAVWVKLIVEHEQSLGYRPHE